MYLYDHPEHAFTGLIDHDSRIQDERFSEGVAMMAVMQASLVLGYDQATAQSISELLTFYRDSEDNISIAHLEAIDKARLLQKTLGQVALDTLGGQDAPRVKVDTSEINYPGYLGYGSALSQDEVLEFLTYLKQQEVTAREKNTETHHQATMYVKANAYFKDHPEEWTQLVLLSRGGREHPSVDHRRSKARPKSVA
jgi:hypothetical protein